MSRFDANGADSIAAFSTRIRQEECHVHYASIVPKPGLISLFNYSFDGSATSMLLGLLRFNY